MGRRRSRIQAPTSGVAVLDRADKALNSSMLSQARNTGLQPVAREMTYDDVMAALNGAVSRLEQHQTAQARALPRDPADQNEFGPMYPLAPQPIDVPDPKTGQPTPRAFAYPVAWNLPGNGNREVPWQVLRNAADGVDIIRRCIQVCKAHVRALDWSFDVSAETIQDAYADDEKKGREEIEKELRKKYRDEILRMRKYWLEPCRGFNGWRFGQLKNSIMEELLVLDAVVLYTRRSVGGDPLWTEQVDGSTIKPLLNVHGARPMPPHPAYQQVLYGFPRGEYAAHAVLDENGNETIPGGITLPELFYYAENVRAFTPYGYSAVEQALTAAALYMARQGWMMAEYQDGSVPTTLLTPPADPTERREDFSPEQRRTWEQDINNELGGQTRARHRMKVVPPGWTAEQLDMVDERYKPEYDLHLIKLVCGFFGVTITELGFTEQQGLGASGVFEGHANVSADVGQRPYVAILTDIINKYSQEHLGCPCEVTFGFVDPGQDNDKESDEIAAAQMQRGSLTWNEDRRRQGKPTYSFPEADMPALISGDKIVFLEGSLARQQQEAQMAQEQHDHGLTTGSGKMALEAAKVGQGQQGQNRSDRQAQFNEEQAMRQAESERLDKALTADQELAAYRRWRRRNPDSARTFVFKALMPDDWPEDVDRGRVIFKAADEGDDADPKAEAPAPDTRWPAWLVDTVIAQKIADALRAAMSGLGITRLVRKFTDWAQGLPEKPTEPAVRGWLEAEGVPWRLTEEIGPPIRQAWTEGVFVGQRSARAVAANVASGVAPRAAVTVDIDWDRWRPGDERAARKLLTADGRYEFLTDLLRKFDTTIPDIAANRVDEVAMVLADGLEQGRTPDEIAQALRGLLDDPKWAKMVALTETNRAVSWAATEEYRQGGIMGISWMTALDQRVCKICLSNEFDEFGRPIVVYPGQLFPSGDPFPPGHPRCRCAPIPHIDLDAIEAI